MKILSKQKLILNRQVQKRELEREHGRVLIIHEGHEGGYMNDILEGSIINF